MNCEICWVFIEKSGGTLLKKILGQKNRENGLTHEKRVRAAHLSLEAETSHSYLPPPARRVACARFPCTHKKRIKKKERAPFFQGDLG